MKPAQVLLLTEDDQTVAAVEAALRSGPARLAVSHYRTIQEVRSHLAKTGDSERRDIAIVDIDGHSQQVFFELSKTVRTHPGMLFVVVSREFNEALVLQAMQAGARHFLRKTAIKTELGGVLDRLLLVDAEAASGLGDVISVLSCSGGCGATTVAVNLAAELRMETKKPVVVVDLDPYYGPVGHHLNVQGSYGIAHILSREDTIDRNLIESSVVHAADGLYVLLSPAAAEADRDRPMEYDRLHQVLDVCRESYGYVIADAPRLPRKAVQGLASVSRAIILVLRPTLRDTSFGKSMVGLLKESGLAPDRILVLANQVGRRGGQLGIGEIQKALGLDAVYPARADWRKAVLSLNRGQPLADVAKWSGLRRDLRRIADRVLQLTSNEQPQTGGA